jgi:hypothetical protein
MAMMWKEHSGTLSASSNRRGYSGSLKSANFTRNHQLRRSENRLRRNEGKEKHLGSKSLREIKVKGIPSGRVTVRERRLHTWNPAAKKGMAMFYGPS